MRVQSLVIDGCDVPFQHANFCVGTHSSVASAVLGSTKKTWSLCLILQSAKSIMHVFQSFATSFIQTYVLSALTRKLILIHA